MFFSYYGRRSNKYLFRVSSAVSDIGSASDSPRATVWGPQDHEILSDNKPIDSAGHCRFALELCCSLPLDLVELMSE